MWSYLNISVKGISHKAKDIPCQDNNHCSVIKDNNGLPTLILIVSDGAGSASKAEIGSFETCQRFSAYFTEHFKNGLSLQELTKDFIKDKIVELQNELIFKAESDKLTIRDYAATFLCAVIDNNSGCFAQIGDGAIVIKGDDNEYVYMFVPQNGEYANETFFVTDKKAIEHLQFEYIEKSIYEIAIFSDGIQNLVLNFQNHEVNQNFFSEWFNWLSEIKDKKIGKEILGNYLDSPKINEQTEDDKTLILALRTDE